MGGVGALLAPGHHQTVTSPGIGMDEAGVASRNI